MTSPTSTITPKNGISIQALLDNIDDMPSIPETLMAILNVLDDPHSGASDLADVVRLDAPLMTKVLRLANSPYYSQRGDLADIHRCVAVLGYRTVRQVAICITVATTVVSAVAGQKGSLDYRELWRHSVVTGAIAKHLAGMVGYPDPEEVFTGGLLHDMGKFVLELHSPENYGQVIARRAQSGLPLCVEEEREFGFNHAAIGQAFGQSWRFPDILVSCFGLHHEEGNGRANSRIEQAIALVALGDYLAHSMLPPRCDLGFDPKGVNVAQLHQNAGLEIHEVEGCLKEIRQAVKLASGFIDLQ